MAQVVDLGSHLFKTNRLEGQCLVSRATGTLVYSDDTNATKPTNRKVDLQNAWITPKQELIVELYIEADSDPVIMIPNFVKQIVETVQVSLIGNIPYLRMSTMHHEYRRLGGPVVLHISVVLRKVPDLSLRKLPKRLPRKVKACAAEPHPPPGIVRVTLSHITIYMRGLRKCTPWTLFLTNLWLKHPHSHKKDDSSDQRSNILILSPSRSSAPLSALWETADTFLDHKASGGKYVQQSKVSPDHNPKQKNYTEVTKIFELPLRCLVNDNQQPFRSFNKWIIEEGPKLSEVAPAFFKPGHYENLHQRAGLIPVVSRSMARVFLTCQSSSVREKISSVESNLRASYGTYVDREGTNTGDISRSLIKCVFWTSLQRGTYKVEWPKQSMNDNSITILLSDNDLLGEGSDQYDSDGQMLSSSISSETGSDDILSHCDDDIELDSGYSSLSSPEKLFPFFSDLDSPYAEIRDGTESGPANEEFDFIVQLDTEERDIIRSSSYPPAVSDMSADNVVTSELLGSSEAFNLDDIVVCENQDDEDMMENSSSISTIPSSTYHKILADLKPEPEVKLGRMDTDYTDNTLKHIESAH